MASPGNISVNSSVNYLSMLNREDDFRVRYTDCNKTLVTANGFWETHTQISCEIILIERGTYRCELNGHRITLKPWDMLIVQPGQKHRDFLYKGCSFFAFHFHLLPGNGKFPPPVFAPEVEPEQQILHLDDRRFFMFLTENLMEKRSAPRKGTGRFHLDNALFEAFFRKIMLIYPDKVLSEAIRGEIDHDADTELLYAVFSRHLAEMPPLETLCRECRMSRSALHRLCLKTFGMPPRKAFMHCKILQARSFILRNPGIRVKEVAEVFGFKTPYHFSRIFLRETGSYPKKFTKADKPEE